MAVSVTIRALVQIDRLQPKFAAYNGATVQGSIPLAGDTILIGEGRARKRGCSRRSTRR